MWQFLLGLFVGEIVMLFIIALFNANKESEDKKNDNNTEG
jgi:hypothetical protein